MSRNIITGTGAYIPTLIRRNEDFSNAVFLNEDGSAFNKRTDQIIENFKKITGIEERRYASADMNASEMAAIASLAAIEDSGIDKEKIDQIIVAHNYGDLKAGSFQPDTVPSLAARVKHKLGIKNPSCIAYDVLFGCPGWLQGLIQADCFIRAGAGTTFLVVGTETLSRTIDPFDRDGMIFSDGAGACILQRDQPYRISREYSARPAGQTASRKSSISIWLVPIQGKSRAQPDILRCRVEKCTNMH